MATFVIIGALGLILILLAMLFDGIFDFADGLLSGTGIGVAAVIFGASGVIVTSLGFPSALSYVISGVLGLLALVLSNKLTRKIQKMETKESPSLVGVEGMATITISPESGEVRLDSKHELEPRLATSEHRIPAGSRIVVIGEHGGIRVKLASATNLTKDGVV